MGMRPSKTQFGVTVIELMVSIAVLLLMALIAASLFQGSFQLDSRADRDVTYHDARRFVDSLASCKMTAEKYRVTNGAQLGTCNSGALIPIYDKKGNLLISGVAASGATPKKFGKWLIRAVCYGAGYQGRGLNIEIAFPKERVNADAIYSVDPNDFRKDPNGEPYDWTSPAQVNSGRYTKGSVYAIETLPCRDYFKRGSASTSRCPVGQIADGFDVNTGRPKCRTLANLISNACPAGLATAVEAGPSGLLQANCALPSVNSIAQAFTPAKLYGGAFQFATKDVGGQVSRVCIAKNDMAQPPSCSCPPPRNGSPKVTWDSYMVNQWTSPCILPGDSVAKSTFMILFDGLRAGDPNRVKASQNGISQGVDALSESSRHCYGNPYFRYFDSTPQSNSTYGTSFHQCWAEVSQ